MNPDDHLLAVDSDHILKSGYISLPAPDATIEKNGLTYEPLE